MQPIDVKHLVEIVSRMSYQVGHSYEDHQTEYPDPHTRPSYIMTVLELALDMMEDRTRCP